MKLKVAVIYHSETGNTRAMADLIGEGCIKVEGIEAKVISIKEIRKEKKYLSEAKAVIFGSPTYEGLLSWQMKKALDTLPVDFSGKLGGVFASSAWPGGGGADLAELCMIAAMLVEGMLVYSGGYKVGEPFLHFGAMSRNAPKDELYRERCIKLGETIAAKARELFGKIKLSSGKEES